MVELSFKRMAYRHLARSLVLQTLFAIDYVPTDESQAIESLHYVISEFGASVEQPDFLEYLLVGTYRKRVLIDEIIEKAAPEWPIDKINAVDRNILRLGLFELLFGDYEQVPPKVAINEAIELAKSFGGESSSKFVNGVLGAVYKEIGEPGKDQQSKKKELSDEEFEQLPIEKKAGSVIYSMIEGTIAFAMVHDIFGYWTLSKGSVEESEEPVDTAVRKAREEIGLPITIKTQLGENMYVANHPEKGRVRKSVHYFLAEAPYQELTLETTTGGLDDARWFSAGEVVHLRMYEDVTALIAQAIDVILQDSSK
jgi:N utilization substance protein B